MEPKRTLFKGVSEDFRGRAACYKQDWQNGFSSGLRILAPTLYIFFASVLPVIAFGEQLSKDTGWFFFFALISSMLLICRVCIWTAVMLFLMAMFNAAAALNRFTRNAMQVLICGLLGIPPSNGVLPQAPMHTRSLAVLRRQALRKKMVQTAKEGMMNNASSSEVYGKMQEAFIKMDDKMNEDSVHKELKDLKDAVIPEGDGSGSVPEVFDPEKHLEGYLPVRVNEQRAEDESIARGIEAPPEYASEILEEFTTHRGELKHRAPSFRDERLIRLNSVQMTRQFSRISSFAPPRP
ncbi:hypothetical protein ACQ4PT_060894 [Festuca glaucescens]